MKIIIEAEPKEIAALVTELAQERPIELEKYKPYKGVTNIDEVAQKIKEKTFSELNNITFSELKNSGFTW